MPFINLNYGPYHENGIIRHKTQRLHGLIRYLTTLGYEIEIVASPHLNRLTVDILGREIFRCNIKNLLFNLDCEDDVVCQRMVAVIEEAKERFCSDDNIPKFMSIKNGKRQMLRMRNIKGIKGLLASDVGLWYEIFASSSSISEKDNNSICKLNEKTII